MIATGIGLHNFSEGLAIGQSAAAGDISLALVLVIGFGLHNATEGFGIVGPFSGTQERPSWGFLALVGLIGGGPTFFGTLLGQAWVSEALSIAFLALAAGSILYVVIELLGVCRELRPQDGRRLGADARPHARLRDRLRARRRRRLARRRRSADYPGRVPLAAVYPLVSSRAVARPFTYEVPDDVGKGAIVQVRLGRSTTRGVVVEVGVEPPAGIKLSPAGKVLDADPADRSSTSRSGSPTTTGRRRRGRSSSSPRCDGRRAASGPRRSSASRCPGRRSRRS